MFHEKISIIFILVNINSEVSSESLNGLINNPVAKTKRCGQEFAIASQKQSSYFEINCQLLFTKA